MWRSVVVVGKATNATMPRAFLIKKQHVQKRTSKVGETATDDVPMTTSDSGDGVVDDASPAPVDLSRCDNSADKQDGCGTPRPPGKSG